MIHKSRFINFMPTACWGVFMFIPFFLTIDLSTGGSENSFHLISLLIATIFIISGDFLSFHKKEYVPYLISVDSDLKFIGLLFCFVSIFGLTYQLSLLENIPFIEKLKGASDMQVAIYREESSKLLNTPPFIKYFFNWCADLLPIIGITCLFKNKNRFNAFLLLFIFFTWSLLLAVKLIPIKILFFTSIILLSLKLKPFSNRQKNRINIFFLFSLTLMAISLFTDKNSKLNPLSESFIPLQKIIDNHDNSNYSESNFVNKKIEYIIYRSILVPIRVSNQWFDYYTNHEEKIGFSDIGIFRLFNSQKMRESAAQKIGYYYYIRINPEISLSTMSANASFDADAYAHFGVWGVLIASTLLLIIRLLLTYLCFNNLLSLILRNLGILILSITIPQASIQAILVPQGLIVILFLMAFLKYYEPFSIWLIFRRNKETREIS